MSLGSGNYNTEAQQQQLMNHSATFPNVDVIQNTTSTSDTTLADANMNSTFKVPGSGSSSEFLQKTYSIINDCDPSVACWWNEGFIIKDPEEFSSRWLPQYFRTNKFESFTRQLKYYGFKKFHKAMEGRSIGFFHEFFKPGSPDQWHKIKRATNGTKFIVPPEQSKNDLFVVDVDELKATVQDLKTEVLELRTLVNDLRRISTLQVEMMMRSGLSSSSMNKNPNTATSVAHIADDAVARAADTSSMLTSSHTVGAVSGSGIGAGMLPTMSSLNMWNARDLTNTNAITSSTGSSSASNTVVIGGSNRSGLHSASSTTVAVAGGESFPSPTAVTHGMNVTGGVSSLPSLIPTLHPIIMDSNQTDSVGLTFNITSTSMATDTGNRRPSEVVGQHHHQDSNKEEAALALAALSENSNVPM